MASIYDRVNTLENDTDPEVNSEIAELKDAVKTIEKWFRDTSSELNEICNEADKMDEELESVIDVLKNIDSETDDRHDIETEIKHAIELLENVRTALF